jgi:hypothetical protein
MSEKLLKATHGGEISLGGMIIKCAVLEDETRILSDRGVSKALQIKRGGAHWQRVKEGGAVLPVYLSAKNLTPFIGKELMVALTSPIKSKNLAGNWIPATTLPDICDVWIRAAHADKLHEGQKHIGESAYSVLKGFAHVGIIALVDEATGFQVIRDRKALQAILDRYLLKELAAWAKRFPDEFYRQIFRLRGWEWRGMKINRPSVVGRYTNDLVYERLAPGILKELKARMPKTESGNDKGRLQQLLTEEVGHPALQAHLQGLMALQRAAPERGWGQFHRMVERAYPKFNETIPLALPEDDENAD